MKEKDWPTNEHELTRIDRKKMLYHFLFNSCKFVKFVGVFFGEGIIYFYLSFNQDIQIKIYWH